MLSANREQSMRSLPSPPYPLAHCLRLSFHRAIIACPRAAGKTHAGGACLVRRSWKRNRITSRRSISWSCRRLEPPRRHSNPGDIAGVVRPSRLAMLWDLNLTAIRTVDVPHCDDCCREHHALFESECTTFAHAEAATYRGCQLGPGGRGAQTHHKA